MKKKSKCKKRHISVIPVKPLNISDKKLFNEYREAVDNIDELTIVDTIDALNELENNVVTEISLRLNETISFLESSFNAAMINTDTQLIERVALYMKSFRAIIKFDTLCDDELRMCINSINACIKYYDKQSEIGITQISKRIIHPSDQLINHIYLYLRTNHSNQKKLLDYLIKETVNGMEMHEVECVNKVMIIFFNKIAMLSTDIPELNDIFKRVAIELEASIIKDNIIKILAELDIERIVQENDVFSLENALTNSKENIDEEDVQLKRYQKEKHYDFKELEELALSNGYVLSRVSGDHYIYNNKIKKHSIPIPHRSIGKGLSIAIKKELLKL